MNIETARPGLRCIMRELDATRWHEDGRDYVVSVKITGRRRCHNYLVRLAQIEGEERSIAAGSNPLGTRWRTTDFTRLDDSDYR
jgi:hypothetical protein